eukprot:3166032-Prymnesium_polylepis.1
MRPEVTEEAAVFCKVRFRQVVESMYSFKGSPTDRASLPRPPPVLPPCGFEWYAAPRLFPLARFADYRYVSASYTPRGAPPSP